MQNSYYSPFKAVHHIDKIKKAYIGEPVSPVNIQIDITGRCNHSCPYCFYRGFDQELAPAFIEKNSIPFEAIEKILFDSASMGVRAVEITGGGEPCLHKNFHEIFEVAAKYNLETALVTNGVLLRESDISTMASNLIWARISLDASNSKDYAKIRRCPENDFYKAVTTMTLLKKITSATVGLSFIIHKENYNDIIKFAEFAKKVGADNIRYSMAYTPQRGEYFKEIYNSIMLQLKEALKLSSDTFKVFDFGEIYFDALNAKKKKYCFCGFMQLTTAIGNDGYLYPCCAVKYISNWRIGNVIENGFKHVWNIQRPKWMESFTVDNCPQCWQDKKNEFIEYILNSEPKHINFP